MAVFNPEFQTPNLQDWTNVSRPVQQPDADKSKGLALSTAATGIEEGAKLAEGAFEDYTKEKIHAGVDAIRDTTTAAYESIRRAQIAGVPPDPRAAQVAGFTGSLTQGSGEGVPEALQAGLDKATQFNLAKSQGRGNDTLYTGALNALQKQLRAEYPGHRDFIDEQISKISGVNPANAYMQNLLVDINRAGVGKEDAMTKHVLGLAFNERNAGNPEVQQWLLAAQHNVPNAMEGLTRSVMKSEQQYWQHNQWKQKDEETKGNLSADADNAKFQYNVRSNQLVDQVLSPVLDIPGLTAPRKIQDLIADDASGKVKLNSEQRGQLVSALTGAQMQLKNLLAQEGNTYSPRIKDEGWMKSTQEGKAQQIATMIDAVTNERYGTMYEMKRLNSNEIDATRHEAYHSPIGQWVKDRSVLTQDFGPNWMNYLDSLGISKGNLGEIQSFFNRSTANASASPDLRTEAGVSSLNASLEATRAAKQKGYNVPQKAYDDLVDNVNLITKAREMGNEGVAKNVIDWTFDPAKNSKLMDFFGRDFTDTNGVFHKGKFAVYDTLTSGKVTDAINNLNDKPSWQKYKDWQELSFKKLFGEETQKLNDLQEKAKSSSTLGVSVVWNSDNHRFMLSGPAIDKLNKMDPAAAAAMGPTGLGRDVAYALEARRSVNALNSGLGNLAYMHSKEGGDTNAYLFNVLMDMGYSPTGELHVIGPTLNFPQRAIQAMIASQKPKPTAGEAFKAAQ